MFDLKAPDRKRLLSVEVVCDFEDCLTFSWVTKGSGFGMTTFWQHERGVITAYDECMGKVFTKSVLEYHAAATPGERWPIRLRQFENVDRFVAACVLGRPGDW